MSKSCSAVVGLPRHTQLAATQIYPSGIYPNYVALAALCPFETARSWFMRHITSCATEDAEDRGVERGVEGQAAVKAGSTASGLCPSVVCVCTP